MNKSNTIKIGTDLIGSGHPPYIIAEMSANHNGDIENAFKIIERAKTCGANAVKIQTYLPETMTLKSTKPDFMITEGLWAGKTLYDVYAWAYTPWEWHKDLFAKANEVGITLFSSPFDKTAVDLLENLNTPAYKIASFEAVDHPLIAYAASTHKPMIISTGMATEIEILEAVDVAKSNGCTELAILHCVSGYPAPEEDYNLKTISDMRERFGLITGLSDHTLSNTTAVASVALGAGIVEKHFTLDRDGGGADDSFSILPAELSNLVQDCKRVWQALGSVSYELKDSEKANRNFRRSLYFVDDVSAGTVIGPQHVRSIRPGFGLAPKHYDAVMGRCLMKNASTGTPVTWEYFK